MLMNKSGTVTPRRKIFSRSLCFQSGSLWKETVKNEKQTQQTEAHFQHQHGSLLKTTSQGGTFFSKPF